MAEPTFAGDARAYLYSGMSPEQRAEFVRALSDPSIVNDQVVTQRELLKRALLHWATQWVKRWVIREFAGDLIRAYHDGAMTPQQLEAFELAMFDDPQLASMVDAERQLRIGMRAKFAPSTERSD